MIRIGTWIRSYSSATAVADLSAAVVVVVMLVPQSLAYAQLAGMPLEAGLYASILPLMAYALFGTSSTLAVGPVAVASLMTAGTVSAIAAPGSAEYAALAMALAVMSGLMLFVAGVCRMGVVANLMSHPVVAGFMSGAALLIVLGQVKPLLGMRGSGETAFALASSMYAHLDTIHGVTAAIGVSSLILIWAARLWLARGLRTVGIPAHRAAIIDKFAPVVVISIATAIVAAGNLHVLHGVAVVGEIPAGIPHLGFALPSLDQLQMLIVPALVISLIGFVESVSVGQALGARRGERVDPNAELRGLGAANIASGWSGGFPVTGGLSRSIVNFSAGARTPFAGVFSAMFMLGVVAQLTSLFHSLPPAALAATIIVPVSSLIDVQILRRTWRYARADAWAYLGTALGVLGLGVEAGIVIGVAVSLATILWEASRPHIAELGRVPGTSNYRNVKRAKVETVPHIVAIRVDQDLFFANVRAVEQAIDDAVAARAGTRHLILDMSAVNRVDFTGLERLVEINHRLQGNGVVLHLAEVKGPVLDRLERSTFLGELSGKVFRFTHDAFTTLTPTTRAQPGA
jgi:SulP family sulfate permease